MSPEPAVELASVSKSYVEVDRRHVILDGVDLRVEQGERVGILGPSGSGKSTLLNLVSGLDRPDGGTLRVAGRDLGGLSERERTLFRRRHVGFVFQFFNLIPTLTVLENLLLPLELNGMLDGETRARAGRLLDEVGLADRDAAYPDRLSGGERQRVALVRALVHRPTLLLADEPTGNLDEDNGRVVADLLFRLSAEAGGSMIVVTHSADLASGLDRTYRLTQGHLEPLP